MAGSVLQNAQDSATAGATSIGVALGAAVTAGNTVIAFVGWDNGTQAAVTMGNGTDSLTLVGSVVNDSGLRRAMYAKVNCTGGGSTTFTWSNSTSLTNRRIWVFELSGLDTGSAVVANSNPAAQVGPGTGTDAITTGSVSNSAGLTAFHIGVSCIDTPAGATSPPTAGTGMTSIATGWNLGTADPGARAEFVAGIAASAGSTLTWTANFGSPTYKSSSAMFKETAVGGSTAGRNRMMMGFG